MALRVNKMKWNEIVGDVNINLLDTDSTSYANYTDCFTGFGFESLVECPTRVASHGTGTLIDHVLSNLASPPCVGVVDTDITDHFPIFLTFENITHTRNISYTTSVFSSDSFVEAISTTDWVPVMSMSDPDAALRAFCSSFLLAVSTNTRTVLCKKIQVSTQPMDDQWSSKKFKEERKYV